MLQEKALAILKSGKSAFLTGSAGTGKTYVLNQYITYLKERKVPAAITASTGIAATHINGITIHSWSGIGVKEHLTSGNLASMQSKAYLKKQLGKVKVLIIDEISMLHKNQLDLVDTVLQYFKDNNHPFGGIQVVLCGDFFQLPPIGKQDEKSKDKLAFMSKVWVKSNLSICYLTEQYRQNDTSLNHILNEIRNGNIAPNSYHLLKQASLNKPENGKALTKLYTHNYDVDRINLDQLTTLNGVVKKFNATTKGNKKLVETLKKSVLAGEELMLKIGAKVMFVKNNHEKGYVNGSLGTVVDYNDKKLPLVKLHQGKLINVEQEDWTIRDDNGKLLASYKQLPLRLAWAITIHKCQGMTLDAAEIDLSKTFERGQGYVALSRLKKLENLCLIGLNEMALKVDPLATKADQRFQELSIDVDNEFTVQELDALAPLFIKKCGGITDKKEIKKNQQKLKEKQKGKLSTYAVTHIHLQQKRTLEEIAELRGLSIGTILGHLIKIRKDYPKEDLSFYCPSNKLLEQVGKVYLKQPKSKLISLSSIYGALAGKVSYDDIKLAIAFLDS